MFQGVVNDLRRDLGLPPTTPKAIRREQDEKRWPILHGFSEHVVPRPKDWRPGLDVVGYWFAPMRDWEPPTELRDFLADGPPPVYFGYGSGSENVASRLSEITAEVARKAGVRAVVSNLDVDGDDMISVGHVDFDWLFPRMKALVHHGGAGTTALGLWAGVPAVTTPLFVDQHFWGRRLVQLGASPDSIRYQKLDTDRLVAAVRRVIDDASYRARTEALGAKIRDEDGVEAVVRLVNQLAAAQGVR
jgi:UDP:flavonoid glycosyltransferase YjiC (YdhE family)